MTNRKIYFDIGNPYPFYNKSVVSAGIKAIKKNPIKYLDPKGIYKLRKLISIDLLKETGAMYDPNREIVITAGSTSAIFTSLYAITKKMIL